MRILVTGVGGFLGSHVAQHLTRDGYEVVGVDSLTHNGRSSNIYDVISNVAKFHWIRHDLGAPFSRQQVKEIGPIDSIVNCASLASVDFSILDPVTFVQSNVNLMLHMLELARHIEPTHFIQVSTDEVYGTYVPSDDTHHTPSSPYAASKAAQEDLCTAWFETFNVPISVVRSANMFGERQSELAFIPRVVRALINGEVIKIHVDRYGKPGVRNYSYVGNVAHYLAQRATREKQAVYNTTLRGQITLDNLSLALNVAAILGIELQYEFVDGDVIRPGYDVKYELHGTDWDPEISASAALRATVINIAYSMGWSI